MARNIGDRVYIYCPADSSGSGVALGSGEVVRVTPTGQFTVKTKFRSAPTIRFDNRGREIGKHYRGFEVITAGEYEKRLPGVWSYIREREAQSRVRCVIHKLRDTPVSRDNKTKLLALVSEVHDAVKAL